MVGLDVVDILGRRESIGVMVEGVVAELVIEGVGAEVGVMLVVGVLADVGVMLVEGIVAELEVMKVIVVVKVGVVFFAHFILRMLSFTSTHVPSSTLYFQCCHM